MPNEFLGYKDQLWKVSQRFSYTGSPQELSLDAGTYLLMCKGARGGSAAGHPSYGGLSVGKLTLASSATMYAYVGGNGHTYGTDGDADGGWNGGGDGGSTSSGGGGATDIRLSRPADIPDPSERIPELPAAYQQIEYIDTTDAAQYIDLGMIMTKAITVRMKTSFSSLTNTMTVVGANDSTSTNKWYASFDQSLVALIPAMTSTTTPSGTIDAGSYYGYGYMDPSRPLWAAFDQNMSTYSEYLEENINGGWLSYEFDTATRVDIIRALMGNYTSSNSITATLYVYDDQNVETEIGTVTVTGYNYGEYGIYSFNVNQTIKKLKFVYGQKTTGTNITTFEIQAYAYGSGAGINLSDVDFHNVSATFETPATVDFKFKKVIIGADEYDYVMPSNVVPSSTANLYLFGRNNNGTFDAASRFQGRIYYVQVYRNMLASNPYYFEGSVTATENGRQYTTFDGPQFSFMVQLSNGYAGPFVIAQTDYTGALYTDYGSNVPFTYNGETWRHSNYGGYWQTTANDSEGHLQVFPLVANASDASGFAAEALDYINETYPGEDQLIMELVPCYRKSDNVIGMYDTISDTFFTGEVSGIAFDGGSSGAYPVPRDNGGETPEEYRNRMSLLTRIIVAGGGGGRNEQNQYATPSYDYNGYGGGAIGGPIDDSAASIFNGKYAGQDTGYSFGQGEDATNVACGAGGGWYGGYAASSDGYGSNGGGGSGYILTSTSYRPSDYTVPSTYNMTDTYTTSSKSTTPEVIVYELASASELRRDDTILFIPTADQCNITLNAGEYKLQCWGGGGGTTEVFTQNTFPQGGYAEGVLTLDEPTELAVNVAGSGCGAYTLDASKMYTAFPDLSANGGGVIWSSSNSVITDGGCGGGATDIGIATTDETVYTIPNEYQPVDYAEFSGTQYIDTGIVLNGRSNVEFCITPSSVGGWKQIFGASQRNFVGELSFWINGLVGAGMRYANNDSPQTYTFSDTEKYVYRNNYSKLYINDVLIDAQNLDMTLNTVNTARIGGIDPDHNYVWRGKFHYLIIKDNTKTIQYLIPCIEVSSSEVGFYDLITGTFLRNAGTGTLIAGSNITKRDYTVVDTSDGLNSRIIVAGGAGGSASTRSNIGGAGGGTTGGAYSGSTGSNPGPGTQTESPQDQSHLQINGSFGFGGTGISYGAGGGGGWYGGGGSYCNSNVSSNMSGAGGSGFVYTAESTTPITYDVDSKYQLTDTSFSRPISQDPNYEYDIYFMPRAIITVLGSSGVLFLCRDTQGVKYYDDTLNQWLLTQEALSEELFQSKGYASIPNDTGLLDSYEILVYDPTDDVGTLEMDICPSTQHITGTITANIAKENIDRIVVDTEYNPSEYAVAANITTAVAGTNSTTVTIDISLDKLVAHESAFGKVYSIILYGKDELL